MSHQLVAIVAAAMALALALRGLRSHGLSFERKVWMAVAWTGIIAVLATIVTRMGM